MGKNGEPTSEPAAKKSLTPEQLKLAHVKLVDERGRLKIWVVDGKYVRGHVDEEFTNFGQHYRFPFIPEDELWLDVEDAQDEQRFFIDHLLVERRLMARGKPYAQAIEAADRVEREERRRARDMARLTRGGRELPKGADVHVRLWKKLDDGVSVWIVSGRLVRSVFDIDFTAGGHDYVYEFVPENEVWIDDDIVDEERGYVLLHELHERNRMAEGWPYEKAHAESSRLECHCRHFPDELHDALDKEGWA
jgi:hypothetical protein